MAEEQQVMLVLSQVNKNKNVLADVKRLEKLFWDDAEVLATTEIQIITDKKWIEKYKEEIEKLAKEKGYELETIIPEK